jgi:serine/threonine protein kinase
MDGGDVVSFMRKHPEYSLSQRLQICLGIAQGLEYLHGNDYIHRDIKPMNILMTKSGVPKICDFGVSKARRVSQATVTGTPGYMAKTVHSDGASQFSDDIFSFVRNAFCCNIFLFFFWFCLSAMLVS